MNLKITIISDMMIKYPHDSWNHRTGFGRRGPGFEAIFWRFSVPLFWWIGWFTVTKGIELVNLYSKTCREELMSVNNSDIILVSNYSISFANNCLSNAGILNKWLESLCIIVRVRLRTKMTRAILLIFQYCWVSNHL